MITILTDGDVLKNRKTQDIYDYSIPRETINKSEIVVHVKDGYIMKIHKHRDDINTTLKTLIGMGLKL